jgi:hypothetical protein
MNWDWLVDRAKRSDVQNRLGFVVGLARELAERRKDSDASSRLRNQETRLERSLLAREDTLGRESMTQVERAWLRDNRSEEAKRWRLMTDLRVEHLPYAS